ncbi:MAG: hypothetical protein QOH93_2331, partial [Chloroflexia bacterium]|nr:hypothetical protein [Chloroflexia bacterium]
MGTSRVCRCPLTFCTVIRPAIRPADSPSITASKRHIRAFIKRLSRKHPQAAGYWKMELQERGAVHYHLLILGVEWMDTAWLADVWHEIAAPGEERNRQAGTHVGHVRSIPRVIRYMAKRFHVPDALSLSNVGRCWGRFVNVTVHEGQSRTTVVSFEQAQDVSRTMDKLRKAQLCRGGTSIVTPAPLPHLRRSGTLSSKWYLGDVEQLVRVIDQGQGHMPTRPVHKLRHGKPTIFERVPISRPGSFGAWYRSVSGLKIIGRDAERSDDDGASSIG